MAHDFCYWSIATGAYAKMIAATIRAARELGVKEEFHVWTDSSVPGAFCHDAVSFPREGPHYRFHYLQHHVSALPHEHFVWLDADSWFVRRPENLLAVLNGDPVHATLESDMLSPKSRRSSWWQCPLKSFAEIMAKAGVKKQSLYNLNGGFWVVRRDAINEIYSLVCRFYDVGVSHGYRFNDEPLLCYAMHMLCQNTEPHVLRKQPTVWATDWKGVFSEDLPDGSPWILEDYFSGEPLAVNPSIVHMLRSKHLLLRLPIDR